MVTLPPEFVAIKYPGYFWNTTEKKLYSCKIDGILKPLKLKQGGFFNGVQIDPGYSVSVEGKKKYLLFEILCRTKPSNTVFPVRT